MCWSLSTRCGPPEYNRLGAAEDGGQEGRSAMTKLILVPIEGSARDGESLAMARELARQMSAGIVLLHVAPVMFDLDDVIAAEQRLDAYARSLRAEGIEAHFLVEYGEPASEIAEVARQQDAELIVLAPEQRALLESVWHPSASSGLLRHATSPLFILPDTASQSSAGELLGQPGAKVFIGLDGSQNAEAALPLAIEMAEMYQRPLVLVRIVAPIFMIGAGVEAIEMQRQAQHAEEAEAHRYLVDTRERLATETQAALETTELVGPVGEHLTQLAAGHPGSVLVVGTHGRSGLARLVVGSVAADVLRRATTPLVIVPSRPEVHEAR